MLSLTLSSGDSIKIGDDIHIVIETMPSAGKIKVRVEAPREKNIARMPIKKKKKGNVVILENDIARGREHDNSINICGRHRKKDEHPF